MRVSREQAEKNRASVIDVASRLFRGRGFDGVGIADIMKAAGLTHGGFYGQFASKEQLAAEASSAALTRTRKRWQTALAAEPAAPMQAVASFYLTTAHRDHPESGCAFAALAADASRSGPEVKAAFEAGLEAQVSLLQNALLARGVPADEARTQTLAAVSTLVGALALSRAVNDPALSAEILTSAASRLASVPDG